MRIRILLPLIPILLWPATTVAQPSFDCNKASTPTEHAICASPPLSQLDVMLAQIYQQTASTLGSAAQDQLLAEQKIWIKSRDSCLYDISCISSSMNARIAALSQVAGNSQSAPQPPQPLVPQNTQSTAGSPPSIPNGIWSARYSCKFRSGKGVEEFAARLLTIDTHEQRVFFQFVPLAEQNAPPRYALMHAPADVEGGSMQLVDDYRSGIGGVKPFVLHPTGSEQVLLADFATCKGIQFVREQPSPSDAHFVGGWSGKLEACGGGWEASAQVSFVPAHDGNLFADIEYRRMSSSRPGADYPGRSLLFGVWDATSQQYKFTTLLRSSTLRDGSASPDSGWPLAQFTLRFNAAQDRLVGSTEECSYVEFAREGVEPVSAPSTTNAIASPSAGLPGLWEGKTTCQRGAETFFALSFDDAPSERLSGTLDVAGPNAIMNGIARVSIVTRPASDPETWDAAIARPVSTGAGQTLSGPFRLTANVETETLGMDFGGGECSPLELKRIIQSSPSRTPSATAPDGGTFFVRSRQEEKCDAALAWPKRFVQEFPEMSLKNTATDKLYPKLALIFADDDFVPVFGQPFDTMPLQTRKDVAKEVRRLCGNDPFYKDDFYAFYVLERGFTGDAERPLTSFGVPAINIVVRKAREVRNQMHSDIATALSADSVKIAAPLARSLSTLMQNNKESLWPGEIKAIDDELADHLAKLALTDVDQDLLQIAALADPKEQLVALKDVVEGKKSYHRYLDDARKAELARTVGQEQSRIADTLLATDLSAIEAMPNSQESLAAFEERASSIQSAASLLLAQVSKPIEARVETKRNSILESVLKTKLDELNKFPPNLKGIQASVAWLTEYEAVFGPYKGKAPQKDVIGIFAAKREQLLNDAIEQFENDVAQAALANGPRGVDAVTSKYLSWQGDENLPIWLDYSFIAESYK